MNKYFISILIAIGVYSNFYKLWFKVIQTQALLKTPINITIDQKSLVIVNNVYFH